MSNRRKLFYGITAALIAALLALPATGWFGTMRPIPMLVAERSGLNVYAESERHPEAVDIALNRIAQQNPNDFDLQYAVATCESGEASTRRLHSMQAKYPDDPRVLVAELDDLLGRIEIDRPADEAIYEGPEVRRAASTQPDPRLSLNPELRKSLDALAAQRRLIAIESLPVFYSLAVTGEQLEPDNAYFPAMRAIGCFAMHRDVEAIDAWKRAGSKSVWNDHRADLVYFTEKLNRALNYGNKPGIFVRMSDLPFGNTFTDIPVSSKLRGATRIAVSLAIQAELRGKVEQGYEIRHATRLIGDLMRRQSRDPRSCLVGVDVFSVSAHRPGGTWPPSVHPDLNSHLGKTVSANPGEYAQSWREAYMDYLIQIGHPEEAAAFSAEDTEDTRLRECINAGMAKAYWPFGDRMLRLFACWAGDVTLLCAAAFALAFGGVFAIAFRFSPRLQKGLPLQASARWGLFLALVLTAVGLIVGGFSRNWNAVLISISIVGAIAALIASPLMAKLSIRQVGHGICVMLATLLSVLVISIAGALTILLIAGPSGFEMLLDSFNGIGTDEGAILSALPYIAAGLMMLLPVGMLLSFVVFSRILGVPVASGVTRGMRSLSVPLACALLVGWSVCLLATLRGESAADVEWDHIVRYGELRTYAALAGSTLDQAGNLKPISGQGR